MGDVNEIKKALRKKTKPKASRQCLLSTGSTLLNLATSGDWRGGLDRGRYYFFVGDSSSGKTFLTLTCFAEAMQNKDFANYRLIYDDVEGGALMDFERFFGKKVADRIEPPAGTRETPIYSQNAEDFYFNLDSALSETEPCIYVLDSMDALSSKYEQKKFDEKKKAAAKGTEAKGDYGDGKAKINSSGLRACLPRLRDTGSILIIINQTRDNINAGLFESKKTRSGGHALTFYATLELWSSVGNKLKKTVRGKDRVIGITSKIAVKKNRLTGRIKTVEIPIYYEYGIDDLGSCIDYLVTEGTWKKSQAGDIKASGLGEAIAMKRVPLLRYIEENDLLDDVRLLVAQTWKEIDEACSMGRKPRYE